MSTTRLPPAPKAEVHRATWDTGWSQYHDQNDPLPAAWDDEPPDEVCGFVSVADLDAYGLAVWKAAMESAASVVESRTLKKRQARAWASSEPLAPCELAAAIRALPLPEQGGQK